MIYKLRFAAEIERDLELIEDHLRQAYQGFGESRESAAARAVARIDEALDHLEGFTSRPHRGTEHPDIQTGLRTVTANRFIYYFKIDESQSEVAVLAVFFGGADHQRQILARLGH